MPIILSHRGNLVGPCPSAENRLPTIRAALECGWGVETDIRCDADGRFYISHDAKSSAHETPAEDFFALFRAYPNATIALNGVSRSGQAFAPVSVRVKSGSLSLVEIRP